MQQTMKRCAIISGVITLAAILWMVLSKDFALTIAITTGTVFYHIGIRLLVGWAFDRFMDNQADYRKKWYHFHFVFKTGLMVEYLLRATKI